jgi:hypothetical protein
MTPTVQVYCPQGIDALCAYGEDIARRGVWTEQNTQTALVGLWLSSQISRAQLRGQAEAVGDRAQCSVLNQPIGDDAKLIDRALQSLWARIEQAAKSAGVKVPDQTRISVSIPGAGETGALGAVVTVAVILGSAWVIEAVATKAIEGWNASALYDKQTANDERISAKKATENNEIQARWGATGKLSPVDAARLKANLESEVARAAGLAAPRIAPASPGLLDSFSLSTPMMLGLAAVAALLLLRGNK